MLTMAELYGSNGSQFSNKMTVFAGALDITLIGAAAANHGAGAIKKGCITYGSLP
jgi:hypothetical protein